MRLFTAEHGLIMILIMGGGVTQRWVRGRRGNVIDRKSWAVFRSYICVAAGASVMEK